MKPCASDYESSPRAFTLVEMLTVLAVVAVLMTLLFTGIGAVREATRRAQAKNDLLRLVGAIQAYLTEYDVARSRRLLKDRDGSDLCDRQQ